MYSTKISLWPYDTWNEPIVYYPQGINCLHSILKCSIEPAIVQEVIKSKSNLFFSNAIQVINAHLFRLVG